jgi:hypothetical protein
MKYERFCEQTANWACYFTFHQVNQILVTKAEKAEIKFLPRIAPC